MEFDRPVQIHLDVDEFASDAETFPIAKIVAAHAEKRRVEYRRNEKPIKCGLLEIEGYWSESVPWYEWMTEPQVLEPCATECGLKIDELAAVIAYQIGPSNWQVFSWMSVALQGRRYQEMITDQLSRHNTQIRKMMVLASKRGKDAADSAHNKPGGSRDKRRQIQSLWATGNYDTHQLCAEEEYQAIGMSYDTALKALRNAPKPLSPDQSKPLHSTG